MKFQQLFRLPPGLSTCTLAVLILAGVAAATTAAGCNGDPGLTDQTPLYRTYDGQPRTSGERGSIQITEINWAGSVRDDGTYFADDVFIELESKEERPVDLTGWRLMVRGDIDRTYIIPESEPIHTNEYFVIAAKEDGAFGEEADVIIPDLELGKHRVRVKLVDADERRITSGGSEEHRAFTGGWDTVSVRSMERVQLLFSNSGFKSRSWHAYSDDTGLDTIRQGWRKFTLASPGQANSTDYSGSVSTGSFE